MGAERDRLEEQPRGRAPWRRLGPYLSERAWGTVREDYSADGDAWELLPARPRALARLPLERGRARRASATTARRSASRSRSGTAATRSSRSGSSASTGPEGNHGEDAKEYWWYLDSTPTHSWMRWRYMYPQARVPVRPAASPRTGARQARSRVRARRHRRSSTTAATGRSPPTTPRRRPRTCCIRIAVAQRRPGGRRDRRAADALVPQHVVVGHRRRDAVDPARGRRARRRARTSSGRVVLAGDGSPEALFCDNETNRERLWGVAERDAVPEGRDRRPRRARRRHGQPGPDRDEGGAPLPARGRRRRDRDDRAAARARRGGLGDDFAEVMRRREAEADEFYAELTPAGASRRRGARAAPGARRDALVEAVLPLRRRSAGSTATRPARRRPSRALARAQPRVDAPRTTST